MIASSRGADQFALRLPPGLRARVKAAAQANNRSMNSEVVFHLERALLGAGAATGDEIAVQAPAAADHTAALQGGSISTQAFEVPR